MALTESSMMPLGTQAPKFTLPDVITNLSHSLEKLQGPKGVLVAFICNHCKYVKHLLPSFVEFSNDILSKGIQVVAISSNDIETYPEDAPEFMSQLAIKMNFQFPYLYDETQEVAKLYDATCTPDFFLFDAELTLRYRGRFDDSSPGNGRPVTGADLKGATAALLANQTISEIQFPSMGCNVKWK